MSQTAVWELGRYRPFVRLLARGLIRDWPKLRRRLDQSDLANDVLLKAHQGLAQFRGNSEDDLLNWLRAILVNEFRTVCRREFNQARDPALERSIDESLTRSSVRLGSVSGSVAVVALRNRTKPRGCVRRGRRSGDSAPGRI